MENRKETTIEERKLVIKLSNEVIHQVKIDPKISAPKSASSTSNTLGRSVSAETSPDLNVIENLWSHLEKAVQKHQITSKEQLKSVLQEEWLNIAPETTRHLVESIPRRLEAVISAKDVRQEIIKVSTENPKFLEAITSNVVAVVAVIAEWSRYLIVAGLVTSSSLLPLKTHRVGKQCTLNLSRAQTSSRWCGNKERGSASSGVLLVT
ncbi:hypothetical protein TNCV_52531 [Trichonephila clavipes]|nr:hypothetical protein TNCV_52531 [Trichonephila clavipes]